MKLKDELILRNVADRFIIMPVGKRVKEIKNMVCISSSAAYLFDFMKDNEFSIDDLVDKILLKYKVSREVAEEDIKAYISMLKENNILEPEEGDPLPETEKGGSVRIFVKNDSE